MKQAMWLSRGKLFPEKRRASEDILGQECALHVQELEKKKPKRMEYSQQRCVMMENDVGNIVLDILFRSLAIFFFRESEITGRFRVEKYDTTFILKCPSGYCVENRQPLNAQGKR